MIQTVNRYRVDRTVYLVIPGDPKVDIRIIEHRCKTGGSVCNSSLTRHVLFFFRSLQLYYSSYIALVRYDLHPFPSFCLSSVPDDKVPSNVSTQKDQNKTKKVEGHDELN